MIERTGYLLRVSVEMFGYELGTKISTTQKLPHKKTKTRSHHVLSKKGRVWLLIRIEEYPTMTDMATDETMQVDDMNLNAQSTTIDPSVIQSRILQSDSIQKEDDIGHDQQPAQPRFPELSAVQATGGKIEYRRVRCPPHRYTPLREHWEQILTPLVEYLKLQVGETATSCSCSPSTRIS